MKKHFLFVLGLVLISNWAFGQACAGLFAPTTTCSGVDVNLHVDGLTPATYSWTLPSGVTLVSGSLTSAVITVRWGSGSPGSTNPYNSTVTCNFTNAICSVLLSKTVSVTKIPTLGPGQPTTVSQSVCLNATATALSVSPGNASPYTYQWYSNTTSSNTGGTLISGATSSSHTPSSSVVGTKYYYVVINGASGSCSKTSVASGAITVTDVTITGQPSTSVQSVCLNASLTALSVTATGTSPLTYQWYSNTTSSDTGGTLIGGATSSSYTPPSSTAGTKYYYARVTGNGACSKPSNVSGAITAADAAITAQPSTSAQSVCLNASVTALSVTATGTSPLTYQWYSNPTSSNTGGTLIGGATSSSYTPPSSTAGTKYYYAMVTGNGACSKTSNASGAIRVADATITVQPSTSPQSVCLNTSVTALSVTVTGTSPLTYQWYSNTTNSNTGGTLIVGATNSSYTPLSSAVGIIYYYVIVTGNGVCSKTSNVSGAIMVNGCSEALSFISDYVTIPDPVGTLNLGTGAFTIEVYLRLDPDGVQNPGTLLSKRTFVHDQQQTPEADGFLFGLFGGIPFIQLQETPNIIPLGAINLDDENCHHVAVRRNGSTISFFLDGAFHSNGNFTSSNRDISSPGPLLIGYDSPTNSPFIGWIGEVRIWNIALTDMQIQNNVGSNLSLPQTGLIAYYDMKDYGQTLTDLSSSGLNGTLGSTASADSRDPAWLTTAQVTCNVSGNFRQRTFEPGEFVKIDSAKEVSSKAKLFPNPAVKFVTVELPETVKQQTSITLFDRMGNESIRTSISQGEKRKVIYVGDLPSGVYILRVGTSRVILQKKIVVLKE